MYERWVRPVGAGVAAASVLAAVAAGLACAPPGNALFAKDRVSFAAHGLSDARLSQLAAGMDPAMRALAARHDPGVRRADLWARPAGWSALDLEHVPNLGLADAEGASAAELNALRPFAALPIRPMRPFVLKASAEDHGHAVECLTQAVYYEAAREPEVGQEAVAQVVLNRLRHPAYPKSVCGVVYQGSARTTGCQFTFTCDGSMRWAPEPALWRRAREVAERALAGHVDRQVGSATHYHTQYVAPYWAPTLVKMTQVGQHIFYRWTGPWGEPAAFTGRYAGGEAHLSPAILGGLDARTQGEALDPALSKLTDREITLAVAGEVRTYRVVDLGAISGERSRTAGVLHAPRRQATPDEIRRINQSLEALEQTMDRKSAAEPTSAPAAANVPAAPAP